MVTGLLVIGRTYGHGRGSLWRDPLPLIAAAALATGVADVVYSQVLYAGTYHLGHPVDSPYALRAACLAAVASCPSRPRGSAELFPAASRCWRRTSPC